MEDLAFLEGELQYSVSRHSMASSVYHVTSDRKSSLHPGKVALGEHSRECWEDTVVCVDCQTLVDIQTVGCMEIQTVGCVGTQTVLGQ